MNKDLAKIKLLTLLTLSFFIPESLWAFRLTPMVEIFESRGRNATKSFHLVNDGASPVALEIEVLKRGIDQDGKEERTPTDDFIVYPPQLQINPGERRNIRVSWVGEERLPHEQAYRLIVRQLPVNLEESITEEGTRINFVFEYVASIYAQDARNRRNYSPKLEITESKMDEGFFSFFVKNSGDRHALFKDYTLEVFFGDDKWVPSDEELQTIKTTNILAKSKIPFSFRLPSNIEPNSEIQIKLNTPQQ